MIVFRGLRGGGGAPAVSRHRQAAATPAGGREKRPSGRSCGLLGSPRAALVMDPHPGGPRSGPEKPARPSDVSPSYESKYWHGGPGTTKSVRDRGGAGRTLNDFAFGPLFTAERTHFGTAANLTRGEEWK